MIRSVWLAFIFLACLGVLAVFKVGVATSSKQQVVLANQVEPAVAQDLAAPDAFIQEPSAQEVLAKADKLDDVTDRKPVQAIAIVPPQVLPKPQEKPVRIISRHWSDSYAKVKKRKHHRHHATRTKKHRRGHR
jgi:hypothetical protein